MIRFCTWYSCDECGKPITGTPVVDPKGGYHPWPAQLPDGVKTLTARQPVITYCQECGALKSKGMKREKKYKHVDKEIRVIADRIVSRLKKKKPRGYWTLAKLASHYKKDFKLKVLKQAIRVLRREEKIKKRKGGYVVKHNKSA